MKRVYSLTAICILAVSVANSQTLCEEGFADIYPCQNVDMWRFMTIDELGGANNMNDVWGWTHEESGREFALVGKNNGTAFVEITDPANPVYLGSLPTHTTNSLWRDIKVFANFAFIVAEAPGHGMQVFDLMRLVNLTDIPSDFTEDAHYGLFGRAHNIVINEETGFAFGVGSDTFAGGLHIVDINDPLNPAVAGDFFQDGYTHDAQVVIYNGPDKRYCGSEIAFASNEDALTIVDVSVKTDCQMLSSLGYDQSAYTHQNWITPDHRYVLVNDELDELQGLATQTRTYIFDVADLEEPILVGFYDGVATSIDHNLYIRWNQVYQSNYRSGLRILDAALVGEGTLSEVGFFDVQPNDDNPTFSGTWSNYCYFGSGTVVVTDMYGGLFILRPRIATAKQDYEVRANQDQIIGEVYLSYAPENYNLLFDGLPQGASLSISTPEALPGTVVYTLSGLEALAAGDHVFTITIQHDGQETLRDVTLTKTENPLDGVYPLTPSNGEVLFVSTFEWLSEPQEGLDFTFELSESPDFSTIIYTQTTDQTSVSAPVPGLSPGTYYWRVNAAGECGFETVSQVFAFTEETPIGVAESLRGDLSIWPNPALSELRVSGSLEGSVYIYDAFGRLVLEHPVAATNQTTVLPVAHLAAGMYTLQTTNGAFARFVKQ